ncbi:MAG TPA: alginate lyase family protein [Candidatus Eisenbacteria bacterium]|jgi:hypothetical protein
MRLNTVDAGCTWLALAAGKLADRISWRLARAVRAGTADLHERVLRGARGLGIPYVPAAWIDRSVGLAPPPSPALYPSPTRIEEEAARSLPELRRGFWSPGRGPRYSLGESGWGAAEESGRSMQARFLWHALHPAALLLEGYRVHGDDHDLGLAQSLAERWIRTCLYREREETLWDDHITAMRALVLCDLWYAAGCRAGDRSPEPRSLGTALARHAEKLALGRFYRPGHNHGVTQALALLATASALRVHPSATGWGRLGRRRLEAQMLENVSPEGVHREHSPYYHFFVLRQFLAAERVARAEGRPMTAAFQARLERMVESGASMIAPDGSLVPLGDTWHGAPILITSGELESVPKEASATLRYALSADPEGSPAADAIYPEGGLAILRSGSTKGEPRRAERHITVRLSVHPTSHIHSDALSLTLYAYGSALLIDSGGPYGYGDPFRHRYFTTTAAHNTVSVDSASQSPGPCLVRRWERRPGRDLLEVEHGNYAGVLHRRTLLFFRGRYLLLVDRLESAAPHRYTQRFHFASDLGAERMGSDAVARRGHEGPSLRLVPLLSPGDAVALHHGGEDPAHGWACTGDLERRPTWVASWSADGPSALFATLLVPAPGPRPPEVAATVRSSGIPGSALVEVVTERVQLSLRLGADGTTEAEVTEE